MAETKKKSQYNFGGHKFDTELYIQNLRDNAEGFLNSKTNWTPEQKEEWKHSYNNYISALEEDAKNGTNRFSTDEFGSIIDNKGEFSNTDSDNYYYNDKGEQISGEDYDKLKDRKKKKYSNFQSNMQFAAYANQIGKGLRDALKGKETTTSDAFDYKKNGFDAYWQKKYNPAGTANDLSPYWAKDDEGKYNNRISETLADLDDYMSKQEMDDNVRAAYQNYRDTLSQYAPDSKDFNLDKWKNNLILAANRAGISDWNSGYFNIGTQSASTPQTKEFDINNDQDVIDRYNLAEQIAAYPEQRDHIIDLARRQYKQKSQAITDEYNAAIKQEQDTKNNKIWEQYLTNNPYLKDINKRIGRSGTTTFWSGARSTKKDQNYVSETIMSKEEQDKVHANPTTYKGQLRPELQAALKKAQWSTAENPLLEALNVSTTNGLNLKNLGNWYQYNWDQLMARKDAGSMNGWAEYKDQTGHQVWRRNDSLRKDGTYFYMFKGKDGKLHSYRSKPYSTLKSEITKGQLGMSIMTKNAQRAEQNRAKQKAAVSAQTAQDKGRTAAEQKAMEREGFTGTDFARLTSIAMDLGSMGAALTGPETLGAGTLVSAGLGAASTATNFIADLADGESLSNAGTAALTGLGMDALGLIPGAGAASKTSKIIKTAAKYAPRLLAAYGAYEGYKNMPYIYNSTKKLLTPGAKMTVDDYRNIAQGIGLVTGVIAAKKRKSRSEKKASDFETEAERTAYLQGGNKKTLDNRRVIVDDQVALNFKDKNGKKVTKTFSGEDAEKIRNASSNKEINEVLANYDINGLTLDTRNSFRPRFQWIRNESKKWQSPIHWGQKTATRYDIYQTKNGQYTNASGLKGWLDPYKVQSKYQTEATPKTAPNSQTSNSQTSNSQTSNSQTSISLKDASFAEKKEVLNQLRALSDEWKSLQPQAQAARKNAEAHLKAKNLKAKKSQKRRAKRQLDDVRNKAVEYQKLKGKVNNGKITFDVGTSSNKKQIEIAWDDILKKYGIKYRQGGSIQKFGDGGVNGNPWYSQLNAKGDYDINKYKYSYDTNQLYAGDMSNGPTDFYVSNQNGLGTGRYAPTNNTVGQSVMDIENQDYYQRFGEDLLNEDGTFTPMGEKWAKAVDAQLPSDSSATFYDNTGKLRTKWTVKNNDSLNRPAETYTNLADYVKRVRNDQILGARHNVFLNTGNRYFYKDKEGVQHWVNPEDLDGYQISDKPVTSGWNDDKTVYWNDYELTGASSKTEAAQDKNPENNPNSFNVKDILNNLDITDKWGIPRAMYADRINRQVTDILKKQPLLLDPQEDHRYIQSDLDAEMNGLESAAQLNRLASQPITSDGNLQTAAQLEAVIKGNDAITQGRQQSNQRLREMAEKAWEQEVVNHTNRYNTAKANRQSIYNTKNENNALEAAYLNQKFTVWDALAQEKEFKEKSDYEQMRARADQFAQSDINNAIKYGLSNYKDKYGLTPEDVSLWNQVYVDGSVKLDDIQKDPAKLKQWNKILSATAQIKQDLLGEYYKVPKSKFWTIRQSTYSPTITTGSTKAKNGAKLNIKKVREAAKGEKLAAAQLKAQTADADRFYKTTKDHIDRMYDAINRLTNYSSTKKKRKKKS